MLNSFAQPMKQILLVVLTVLNHHRACLKKLASCLLLVALICLPHNSYSKTLTISKITNNPSKHARKMQPFVDYLVSQLSDYGYTEGKLVFARDPQQLAQYLRSEKVDMASDTPFAYAKTHLYAPVEPIAVRWKNGIKQYNSVIIVRADSGISTLLDLTGKTVAFEDNDSTSGFALPTTALLSKNIQLEKLYSPREKPSSAAVTGYIFSGSEQTTAAWVLKGLVDAGAVSSLEWYKAQNFLASGAQELLAIYSSPPVPRTIEFVRSNLPADVKQRIKEVLYEMHTHTRAQKIMARYQKTSLFEPLDKDAYTSLKAVENLAKELASAGL